MRYIVSGTVTKAQSQLCTQTNTLLLMIDSISRASAPAAQLNEFSIFNRAPAELCRHTTSEDQ